MNDSRINDNKLPFNWHYLKRSKIYRNDNDNITIKEIEVETHYLHLLYILNHKFKLNFYDTNLNFNITRNNFLLRKSKEAYINNINNNNKCNKKNIKWADNINESLEDILYF